MEAAEKCVGERQEKGEKIPQIGEMREDYWRRKAQGMGVFHI